MLSNLIHFYTKSILIVLLSFGTILTFAQETPKEEDFYKIVKLPAPEHVLLEVGGLVTLPNGNLGVSTRRGDVYIVENPTSAKPYFKKFASGLHEILGLAYKDGAFYAAQRGELTKLIDTDLDGKADVYKTIYAWPLSGHYHEYSFGPKIAPDGSFFVTGNVAFGDEEWWRGESRVPWRGWTMQIFEDGTMKPWATGMRSPAGPGFINGEFFYTDNQGDWFGSGGLWRVPKGSFTGHPAGLVWTGEANSPLKLKQQTLFDLVDERRIRDENGRAIKPENIIQGEFKTRAEAKMSIPELQLPAVWLPHAILGISNSEPIEIPENTFGPFAGQVLIGDQGMSMITRVMLEKVDGEYQGAAIALRSGFRSGVLRLAWAKDGSLFVGETNRGWGSAGDANEGLQRLIFNQKDMPFEMKNIKAMPDGFEIEFTLPVDKNSAEDLASYSLETFTYKYNSVYGSPTVNQETSVIKGVKLSNDGLKVRIVTDDLRKHYIHTLTLNGIRSKESFYSLIHPTAYYTLHNIPSGAKLSLAELSTKDSSIPVKKPSTKSTTKVIPEKKTEAKANVERVPTLSEVQGLLAKNTCIACHNADTRQVGPAFKEIAKRKYTNEEIVELIYNPKPANWPGYATEMPPMPQVSKGDALKIAAWINSLN
ncbi:c-type cytochrome [Albibacterium sp.]|uniref:c-type cytochrome n=1 Tax=Albibacterium sp. TaxID=2952885 RepID=UPI002CDC2D30|nr:c-type cytochrome [Albibacterium sp.]HUH18424.1 c-type cytochrome [Albibacterium sp.]